MGRIFIQSNFRWIDEKLIDDKVVGWSRMRNTKQAGKRRDDESMDSYTTYNQ